MVAVCVVSALYFLLEQFIGNVWFGLHLIWPRYHYEWMLLQPFFSSIFFYLFIEVSFNNAGLFAIILLDWINGLFWVLICVCRLDLCSLFGALDLTRSQCAWLGSWFSFSLCYMLYMVG